MFSSYSDDDGEEPSSKRHRKSSKVELKGIQRDSLKILETLESEYRHDLAIHLYSAYLFHTKSSSYPVPKWTAWPLEFTKIPKVNTSKRYIDENSISLQSEHTTTLENEINDPLECLKMELNACFCRMILQKIFKYRDETGEDVEPIVDPPIKIPLEMEAKVIAKIDSILEAFKTASRRGFLAKTVSWRRLLLFSGNTEYYESCRDLFEPDFQFVPKVPLLSGSIKGEDIEEEDDDDEEIVEDDSSNEDEDLDEVAPKIAGNTPDMQPLEFNNLLARYEDNLFKQAEALKIRRPYEPIRLHQRFDHKVDPLKVARHRNINPGWRWKRHKNNEDV